MRSGADRYLVQTIDRFASQLQRERFALVILADPLDDSSIVQSQRRLRQLISEIHPFVKLQRGKNVSASEIDQQMRSLSEIKGNFKSMLPTLGSAAIKLLGIVGSVAAAVANPALLPAVGLGVMGVAGKTFSDLVKRDITRQTGSSVSAEELNREAQELEQRLELHHQRLQQGRNLGLWETGVYLLSDSEVTEQLGASLLRSIAAGQETHLEPIRVHHLSELRRPQIPAAAIQLLQFPELAPQTLQLDSAHPLGNQYTRLTTVLNTEELSIWMGLPRRELPGISARTRFPEFSIDHAITAEDGLHLGQLMDYGVELDLPFAVQADELTKHVFITGTTGSGKSKTTRRVLAELGRLSIPFLVIEPAKMEYADAFLDLKAQGIDVQVAIPGLKERRGHLLSQLRLNPFEPVPGFPVETHLDRLKTTMAASFSMQDILPILLEAALVEAYQKVGWLRETASGQDPEKYPQIAHLREAVQAVLKRNQYGQEIQANLTAALHNRIAALTMGHKRSLFGAPYCSLQIPEPLDTVNESVPPWEQRFGSLFTKPTVINLSLLGDDADKSLTMGLLLGLLHEFRFVQGSGNGRLKHVTVIEEAHRLLRKSEPGVSNSKAYAAEMFADLLAEVRDYGEGLMIVDQVPAKLIPDVLKNTNLKIVHRMLARDDQDALAGAMGLTEAQRKILMHLAPGEAVVQTANRVSMARINLQERK